MRISPWILDTLSRALVAVNLAARKLNLVRNGVLVIPPAAPGSLGDEAMVLATCNSLRAAHGGRLCLIRYRKDGDYPVDVDRVFDLSRYFLQGGARGEELRLLLALLSYQSVGLLGADVLDGYYSDDAVRLRLRLVELAARAGARCAILGFSFNSTPSAKASELIATLPAGVKLLARDERSYGRLAALRREHVQRVADSAFLLPPAASDPRNEAIASWAKAVHERGGRTLGVNLCAEAMRAAGLSSDATLDVARDALNGVRADRPRTGLLLVPHDVRGTASDVELLMRLKEALDLPESECLLVKPPLSARFVKSACANLDAVWTGRMHLAIAAMGQGVPAVAHEYQDKFAGLFADFGVEELVWPHTRMPEPQAIAAMLVDTLDRADALRSQIRDCLPRQTALAQINILELLR